MIAASLLAPDRVTSPVMPGRSRPSRLSSVTLTSTVRLTRFAPGSSASIRPVNASPSNAGKVARAEAPAFSPPSEPCGTDATSHTGDSPLIVAIGSPAPSAAPGRASSAMRAPATGARTVKVVGARLRLSAAAIASTGTPSASSRRRAAVASVASDPARSARYSASAPLHAGTRMSIKGSPARTTSPTARPWPRSTKPSCLACTVASDRSL